jgi:NADH-quinone oxidoreductase subunit H
MPDMDIDFAYIIATLIKIAIVFAFVMTVVAYTTYAERRILAVIQDRLGPNRVGPFGLLQPLADGLKFILKEDIIPFAVDKWLYLLAPIVALTSALMVMIVYPFGPKSINLPLIGPVDFHITNFNVGLLYVFAMTSLGVYGIFLAGWASNSKYSLLGGLRSAAQMISYELALSLAVIGVLIQTGTLDLVKIVEHQSGTVFGFLPRWNIFWYFPTGLIAFLLYITAAVAETNRVPFDLPEAESELVAGFHTEYSAMKFAMFYMAEYANMLTVSVLATTLFFGGWDGPFVETYPLLGFVYFMAKVIVFIFAYIWLRATLPRLRYDQLMNFGWKFLLPVALLNILLTALIAALLPSDLW